MTAATGGSAPALELVDVSRSYRQGEARLDVFRGASLCLEPGEIVALVGPSGAGKSSLLHIAGLLDTPDAGDVLVGGRKARRMSDLERARVRSTSIGFVYQFHHLLPEFTALENVIMPQLIAGVARRDAKARAGDLLDRMNLGERQTHLPNQLSGGEQQRVAIARAVANRPRVLLADEPTGNLDPSSAEMVFGEFLELARSEGLSALIATHNHQLAGRMDRTLVVEDGRIGPG